MMATFFLLGMAGLFGGFFFWMDGVKNLGLLLMVLGFWDMLSVIFNMMQAAKLAAYFFYNVLELTGN